MFPKPVINPATMAPAAGFQRTALDSVMDFEVLINEKSKLWIFHTKPLPYRLAWVEFNAETGQLDLIPHDMRHGIYYIDAPDALHMPIKSTTLAYLYLTDGEKVTGFQKAPVQLRRARPQGV